MEVTPDPKILISVVRTQMPYGKYKGRLIADLPENYLLWFSQKDAFPKGKLGNQMRTVLEIKINGLDDILKKLKKMYGE